MSFVFSKLAWKIISPVVALLLMAAAGMIARNRWIRRAGAAALAALLLAVFLPVGNWLLVPLENRFSPALPSRVDGIILLSGDERPSATEARGQAVMGGISAGRYLAFAALAREYPAAKLAFSGGDNSVLRGDETGAGVTDVAKRTFAALGLEGRNIIYEGKSRTTRENAVLSREALSPAKGENWVLVTSAFHMPRAMAAFVREGWNVYPYPAGYRTSGRFAAGVSGGVASNLEDLTLAAHEYYGLVFYRINGWIE